jgi:hypothetical protein
MVVGAADYCRDLGRREVLHVRGREGSEDLEVPAVECAQNDLADSPFAKAATEPALWQA